MIAAWASMVIASAATRPARIADRRIGLINSLSIIPLPMSVTVAIPDCNAVNSIDSTTMPGTKNAR